jgi:WD40 repeat protein
MQHNDEVNLSTISQQISRLSNLLEEKIDQLIHSIENKNTTTRISDKIKLNIGGTVFVTSLKTLTADEQNFFSGMFEEGFIHEPDQDGEYFIDRNPDQFGLILDHLRGYDISERVKILNKAQLQVLELDVDYYNITTLFQLFPRFDRAIPRIATAGASGIVKIWNLETRAVESIIKTNANCMLAIKNGKLLATGGNDVIQVWDISNQNLVANLVGHIGKVHALLELESGDLASAGHNVKIWNIRTSKLVSTVHFSSESVTSLVNLKGNRIACASDRNIGIIDIDAKLIVDVLKASTGYIRCLCTTKSGMLLSGSSDKRIRVWDVERGSCAQEFVAHNNDVTSLLELDDGRIMSASDDRSIKIWKLESRTCELVLSGHTEYNIMLRGIGSGKVVSACRDKNLYIWNAENGFSHEMLMNDEMVVAVAAVIKKRL